jgi:hypothetical protein
MMEEFKVNVRMWHREPVRLPAMYLIKNRADRYMFCTIVKLSRNGAAVLFPPDGGVQDNDELLFEIIVPRTSVQLNIEGQVRDNYVHGDETITGIQFDTLLPETMYTRCCVKSAETA